MTAAEYAEQLAFAQNAILVMFGCLCILAALIVMGPPDMKDPYCLQHGKARSKCEDEHRD